MIIVFPAKNLVKLQPARIAKGDRNLFSKLKGPGCSKLLPQTWTFFAYYVPDHIFNKIEPLRTFVVSEKSFLKENEKN